MWHLSSTPMSSLSERNRIVYAGQLIRGKGVDLLLEALAHVRVPFECFIFGDGNHRAYCQERSRKLVTNGYSFSNYIKDLEALFLRIARRIRQPLVTTC